MAVSNIPVLSTDYPFFSWEDWLGSLAALVPGGFTYEFEKECWNAIVNKVAEVVADSGLEWDSAYSTAEDALITEEFGDLYAKAANSLRHNMDNAVPVLRWGWANDPAFRGYIGRKDFRGVDEYGDARADDVYPEYIVELVDRLNFLISVLTGEKALIIQGKGLSQTLSSCDLVVRESLPLYAIGMSKSLSRTDEIVALQSIPIFGAGYSRSLSKADLIARKSVSISPINRPSRSLYKADIDVLKSASIVPEKSISKTLAKCALELMRVIEITAKAKSKSLCFVNPVALPALGISGAGRSVSISKVDLSVEQSLPIYAKGTAKAKSSAALTMVSSAPVEGTGKSQSLSKCEADTLPSVSMSAKGVSKTLCRVSLDTAWIPPVWVDGGLWIRQSHSVTQNENGELVIV